MPFYKPREAPVVDWAAMQAERDRVRAEEAAAQQAARDAARVPAAGDITSQLVGRLHRLEERVSALETATTKGQP